MQQNIEHPENDACYEGLAVNKGIEQPDPVNPAIAERLKHLKKKTLTADEYVTGIFRGDINILSQAITLVESARIDQYDERRNAVHGDPAVDAGNLRLLCERFFRLLHYWGKQ